MNRHAREALEYPRIRELVAALLRSPLGSAVFPRWEPAGGAPEVERLLAETAEMRSLLAEEGELPLEGLADPGEPLRLARPEGAALPPPDLLALGRLAGAARRCRSRMAGRGDDLPHLASLASALPDRLPLEDRVGRILHPDGTFREDASPRLAAILAESARNREQIQSLYRHILADRRHDDVFQDDIIAARGGRFVLLVRTGAKGRFPGIVLDRTDSGQAFYMEPQAAIPHNNRQAEILAEEEDEKRRLLRELTDLVREESPALAAAAGILGELDLVQARALFGLGRGHRLPRVAADAPLLIREGRHPLLEEILGPGRVIPLDLEFPAGKRLVLITGPNTGGKTVALKTAGLLVLMAQSGLFIPAAEGSSLPLFREIHADIGDEQSLEQNLSTFSAHLRTIAGAVREADGATLVLLDELGAGTDPAEGGPLAAAILEHLLARGALTLATTHHGSLVSFALATPGAVNASMAFDPSTLRPSYHLLMGLPGRSNAREVARGLGFPEEIVRRSEELRPRIERETADLMSHLAEERSRMERSAAAAREKETEAAAVLARLREEEAGLRRNRSRLLDEAKREARRLVSETRERVRAILEESRRKPQAALQELRRTAEAIPRPEAETVEPPGEPLAAPPREGDRVRLRRSGLPGRALRPGSGGSWWVDVGGKSVEVPLRELSPAPAAGREPSRATYPSEPPPSGRLDIRGLRVDEAEAALTPFLDRAWLSGAAAVEILHGKGTGSLMDLSARLLAAHPGVKEWRPAPPERGGHGVTLVEFRVSGTPY